ncbi:hypothetical protein GC175_29440 [bacterium]|nr:hypothetical protein [bacterium]
MLYSVRLRPKESLSREEAVKLHEVLDTKVIPTALKVEGVNTFDVYQSFNGELVALLDIKDLASVDRILADPGCRATFGELYELTVRTGGEILFDRPQWQQLYGR